jgi:SAM-dependent methyltransferase
MLDKGVPAPHVMKGDNEKWKSALHLSNFVNAYYQYRDLSSFKDATSVLVIGPGQGLDTQIFRWRGYQVTTFDIDQTFDPNVVGSVNDMSMFSDKQFDVAIASHVLEHLPVPYLDSALSEIARVSKKSIIYLPVAGRHFQFRLIPGIKNIDFSIIVDIFNWFHRPDGITARYCAGQHYWELGMRGYSISDIERYFKKYFEIIESYRNRDWNPSHNFVLRSLSAP